MFISLSKGTSEGMLYWHLRKT